MIRGAAVDTLCLHRCSDALALAVSKAEARADCLVAVSGVPLEDTIRAFVSDVIDELPGAPTTTTTTPATTTTTTLCTGCLRDVTGDGVRTWLMVGDSNTSFLACAYPEALQARHDPSEITVVNGGIFGTSAAYWVQQGLLAPLLEQDRPDGVLIALGTNDVASTPPEYVVAYLLELFDQARAWCYDGGCAVAYVATIPPIYCPPNPIELNPQIDAVNALIRAMIPAPNVVDFDSWMPAVWDENYMWRDYDGIHLGCGGQAIRADVCDDVLARVSD